MEETLVDSLEPCAELEASRRHPQLGDFAAAAGLVPSSSLVQLLVGCLRFGPSDRLTAEQALAHPALAAP